MGGYNFKKKAPDCEYSSVIHSLSMLRKYTFENYREPAGREVTYVHSINHTLRGLLSIKVGSVGGTGVAICPITQRDVE